MEAFSSLHPEAQAAYDEALSTAVDTALGRTEFVRQIQELEMSPAEIRSKLGADSADLMAAVAPEVAGVERPLRARKRLEDLEKAKANAKVRVDTGISEKATPWRKQLLRARLHSLSDDAEAVTAKLKRTAKWQELEKLALVSKAPLVESLTEHFVAPRVRRILNEARQEKASQEQLYRGTLDGVDTSSLRGRVDEDVFVQTRKLQELGRLLARLPGGSVGIAGSRGIGKSTALDHVERILPLDDNRRLFRVRVDAPTEYVPREFLMHLLGEIAKTWLKDKVSGEAVRKPEGDSPRARAVASTVTAFLPALLFVAGVWLIGAYVRGAALDTPAGALPVALTLGSVALGGLLGLAVGERLRTAWMVLVRSEGLSAVSGHSPGDLTPTPRTTRVIVVAGTVLALVSGGLVAAYAYSLAARLEIEQLSAILLVILAVTVGCVCIATADLDLIRTRSLSSVTASMTIAVAALAAGVQGACFLLLPDYTLSGMLVAGGALASTAAGCAAMRTSGLNSPVPEGQGQASAVALAREDLRRLQYQTSSAAGWTSGFKIGSSSYLPFEANQGVTRSFTEAEATLTTPDVVSMIRKLLEAIHRDLEAEVGEKVVKVFIGIDELDKLEADAGARDFLNEIKGVFGVPGVIFLVSVSEDAMASFERRGLAFRDVFDTAFDEIVHLPQLSLIESSEILKNKVSGVMPRPFIALGHCFSGGLARDLVRAVDHMVETDRPLSLERVTVAAIHRELRGKWQAVVSALRPLPLEPHVTNLIKVLYQIDRCPDSHTVDDRCLLREDAFSSVYELQLPEPHDSELPHLRTLLRLAGEYLSFAYFCLTMAQFFVDVEDSHGIERLQRAENADQHERHGFDYLARARQHLGINSRLGWEQISYFREAHGLEPRLDFPDVLLGTPRDRPAAAATDPESRASDGVPTSPLTP